MSKRSDKCVFRCKDGLLILSQDNPAVKKINDALIAEIKAEHQKPRQAKP